METHESPLKAGINLGLILGIISVVVTFLIYFVNPPTMVSMTYAFISLALFFFLVIYFGLQYRKSIGGYMDFGIAFKFAFITLLVSGLVSLVGNLLLHNLVDPALSSVLVDIQLENQIAMLEKIGVGDSISSEQLDKMQTDFEAAYTVLGQLKGFGLVIILYAIFALILGAIIKKRDKSLDY
jgi:hypothetical protein